MALLTLHRPKFCSECGSKILRLRWLLWTSRKFCDECATKFIRERFVQPVVAGSLVLVAGLLVGHAWRSPPPPPLVLQRGGALPVASPAASSAASPAGNSSAPEVVEQSYSCGAKTKKGTPCSRRVNGPARCWQHKGAKAMMAQEKLLIKE